MGSDDQAFLSSKEEKYEQKEREVSALVSWGIQRRFPGS